MTIEISVKRQKSKAEKPYIQKFLYTGDGNLSVADWLTEINQKEAKADRIAWECGCLEKKVRCLCDACEWLSCAGVQRVLKEDSKAWKNLAGTFS